MIWNVPCPPPPANSQGRARLCLCPPSDLRQPALAPGQCCRALSQFDLSPSAYRNSFCKFSQSWADVPSALPRRNAVSAVIAVSSLAIRSMRVRGTPHSLRERSGGEAQAESEILRATLLRDASGEASWSFHFSQAKRQLVVIDKFNFPLGLRRSTQNKFEIGDSRGLHCCPLSIAFQGFQPISRRSLGRSFKLRRRVQVTQFSARNRKQIRRKSLHGASFKNRGASDCS